MNSERDKERKEQARKIIRNASIASATAAGAVAQGAAFGMDFALLTPIVINMIIELGELFDQTVDKIVATTFAGHLIGAASGVYVAKSLLGFIPLIGNVVNAAITYPLIELIGWTAYEIFRNGEQLSEVGEEETQFYMKRVARERNER